MQDEYEKYQNASKNSTPQSKLNGIESLIKEIESIEKNLEYRLNQSKNGNKEIHQMDIKNAIDGIAWASKRAEEYFIDQKDSSQPTNKLINSQQDYKTHIWDKTQQKLDRMMVSLKEYQEKTQNTQIDAKLVMQKDEFGNLESPFAHKARDLELKKLIGVLQKELSGAKGLAQHAQSEITQEKNLFYQIQDFNDKAKHHKLTSQDRDDMLDDLKQLNISQNSLVKRFEIKYPKITAELNKILNQRQKEQEPSKNKGVERQLF